MTKVCAVHGKVIYELAYDSELLALVIFTRPLK